MDKGTAELTHGPFLIGAILTILLFGISVTQTCVYWNTYYKDHWLIRYFVLILFVANAVHCIFIAIYLYDSVIIHFGDVAFLAAPNWVFNAEPALSGMISGIVQAFFGWRVKVLTGSWILLVIIEFCSVIGFFMGIATAIASSIVKIFAAQQKFFIVVILWLVSTTLADIIITTTLVIYLKRRKTGFKKTDSQLDRIIRLTVQTGLLTAIWAMVDLLVYLLDPTGTHLIFNCVLPKLYTISFLSSLNSRNWRLDDDENILSYASQDSAGLRNIGGSADSSTSRPEVFVHVESEEVVDEAEKRDQSILARKNLVCWHSRVAV